MAETQKMWPRRDNRSNKRTDLAYSIAWSKHCLRPVKSRKLTSEKFEYRSPVDLGIGDAIYRRPVISICAPPKAHHSPMVWCTPRRFEVISSGSPGNSLSNEPTADAWSSHWVRCIDKARE